LEVAVEGLFKAKTAADLDTHVPPWAGV